MYSLSLLTNVLRESLVIFHILCQIQFHMCSGFPDRINACPDSIPIFFSGHPSLLPLLTLLLLIPQFHQQVLAQLCLRSFLSPLLDFLWCGMESFSVLRKLFLKSFQLRFVPVFLRTVSEGISCNNTLNSHDGFH